MRYRFTILNMLAALYLAGCIIYTGINYDTLSEGEGWGLVGMIGLATIGLIALAVDFILQQVSDPKKRLVAAGIIALAIAVFIMVRMLGQL